MRTGAAAGRRAPVVVPVAALRSQLLHQTRAVRPAFGAFDGDRCLRTALVLALAQKAVGSSDVAGTCFTSTQ